jgi:hypothetical protein
MLEGVVPTLDLNVAQHFFSVAPVPYEAGTRSMTSIAKPERRARCAKVAFTLTTRLSIFRCGPLHRQLGNSLVIRLFERVYDPFEWT